MLVGFPLREHSGSLLRQHLLPAFSLPPLLSVPWTTPTLRPLCSWAWPRPAATHTLYLFKINLSVGSNQIRLIAVYSSKTMLHLSKIAKIHPLTFPPPVSHLPCQYIMLHLCRSPLTYEGKCSSRSLRNTGCHAKEEQRRWSYIWRKKQKPTA